eukprot:g1281.t1
MESYNRDPPVDVVYVIHYEPYSKRRETLAKTLREMGLLERTFWISSPDPPELGGDEYDHMRFVREDANDPIHHAFFGRPLSEREISVSMKHYNAWKRLADSRYRRALILEDDAKLHPHFHTRLWDYVDELKDTNWSLLCLGGAGFGTGFMGACETIPECEARLNRSHVYRKYWNRSETSEIFDLNVMRYADSYVLTRELATRLRDEALPISFPADHLLNYFLNRWDRQVFWCEPSITMQHLHLTESRVSYLNNRSVDILDEYYETARTLRPSAGFDMVKRQQGPYIWLCGTFHLKRDFVNAKRACSRLYEIGLSEYAALATARAMWFLRELDELMEWLTTCRERVTNTSNIVAFSGTIHLFRGEFSLAIEELRENLDSDPIRWNNLAVALAFQSEEASSPVDSNDDAMRVFRSAIDIAKPKNETLASLIERNMGIYAGRDMTSQYYIELP